MSRDAARRAAVLLFFILSLLYCQLAALRDAETAVLFLLYYLYFLFQFILRAFDTEAGGRLHRKTLYLRRNEAAGRARLVEKLPRS